MGTATLFENKKGARTKEERKSLFFSFCFLFFLFSRSGDDTTRFGFIRLTGNGG